MKLGEMKKKFNNSKIVIKCTYPNYYQRHTSIEVHNVHTPSNCLVTDTSFRKYYSRYADNIFVHYFRFGTGGEYRNIAEYCPMAANIIEIQSNHDDKLLIEP